MNTLSRAIRLLGLSCAVSVLALALPAAAQDALTFSYQGTLTDGDGAAVDGQRAVSFRIYDAGEGGEAIWSETHEALEVVGGLLTAEVGSVMPIENLPTDSGLYMGVTIGDEPEISPRVVIGPALRARWATAAAQTHDVAGQDIHPASVSIGDTPVIDAEGNWVGPVEGLRGPQGPQGIAGADGLQGAAGPAGPQGAQGAQGAAGERGLPGQNIVLDRDQDQDGTPDWVEVMLGYDPADAASAPIDDNGDGVPDLMVGPMGTRGSRGPRGVNGPQGIQGEGGPQGSVGPVGPAGPQGLRGERGPQGLRGQAGASVVIDLDTDLDGFADWLENALNSNPLDGASVPVDADNDGIADALRGLQGPKGDQGAQGDLGPQGLQGAVGSQGDQGIQGPAYDLATDTDGDGVADWIELMAGTDPAAIDDVPADGDQDGVADILRGPAGPQGVAGGAGPVGPAGQDGLTPLTDLFVETIALGGGAVAIPRADAAGIDVSLDVGVEGIIEAGSFSVALDITHPDLSQLSITIIAPDATAYSLIDGPSSGVGGVDLNVNIPGDLAPLSDFEAQGSSVVGKQAQGRWILRIIDTDLGNPDALRSLNGFSIAFTRRAGGAWRLMGDLHVQGNVYAQNSCTMQPASDNGVAIPGIFEMVCGNNAPIRLYGYSCGNGQLDPGESCDDGNQAAGDGCDTRCIAE